MIDLVCLLADKNIEAVIAAVLHRHASLSIRPITFEAVVHPQRDSACYHEPEPLLRPFLNEAAHAIVVFDRAWEGSPSSAMQMEEQVDRKLERMRSSWAKAVVADPEIEAWLFRRSPRLDEKLGWRGRTPTLTEELAANGLWPTDVPKPTDPKAAIEWALRRAQKPRSSAIYREIGAVLGMRECVDPSFHRFRATLQAWFPAA
jgi:hypothetical protein